MLRLRAINRFAFTSMFIVVATCICTSAQKSQTKDAPAEKPLTMTRSQIRIKMDEAGPAGLVAWLYVPDTPGVHPVAVMTHGTEYSTGANHEIGAGMYEPEALWFVRRNWAVLMVIRRGYGDSGGKEERTVGACSEAGYMASAHAAALDLKTALRAVESLPRIDADRAIVLGSSAGGFASVALGAEAPPELKAVINFEGGWHSMLFSGTCTKQGLVPVFRSFGATTKVPSLWFYTKNDHLFGPKYATEIYGAFTSGGGTAQLETPAKSGDDGHYLFSESQDIWGPVVQNFLAKQGLPAEPMVSDFGTSPQKLPSWATSDMQDAFAKFQKFGPYKAFAISANGRWGYASGKKTAKIADDEALDRCGNYKCQVIARGEQ